eukprot:510631_1
MVTLHWMLYTLALITLGALSKSQQSFDSMEDSVSDDDEYNCNIFEKKIELCMVWRRVYCEYNPKFNIEKCLKARHCCLFELPTSDDDSDDSTDSDESTDAKCSNGQCDARYCVCDETINGKDFCRIKVRDDRCYFKPCYSDTNCKHGFGCVVACRSFPVCIPQCTIFNDESSSASRSRSISFDSISFSSSSSAHPKPTRKPTPKPTNKPTPKPTPKPTHKPLSPYMAREMDKNPYISGYFGFGALEKPLNLLSNDDYKQTNSNDNDNAEEPKASPLTAGGETSKPAEGVSSHKVFLWGAVIGVLLVANIVFMIYNWIAKTRRKEKRTYQQVPFESEYSETENEIE